MSLLNDALRKRRAEKQPEERQAAGTALGTSRPQGVTPGRKKVLLGGVAAAALAFAAWCWWWPPGETASSFSAAPVQIAALQEEPKPEAVDEPLEERRAQVPIVQTEEKKASTGTLSSTSPASTQKDDDPLVSPVIDRSSPPAPEAPAPKPEQQAAAPVQKVVVKRPVATPKPSRAAEPAAAAPTPPPAQNRKVSTTRMYQKARSYRRQGQIAEAIAMYREVLKIDPDHFDTGFNLTSAYLQTRAYDRAYAMAADLYRRKPDDPRVALNLAIALIGVGQPRQAIDLLDRFSSYPDAPLYEIYFHKGVAYRNIGEPATAVAWYQKAEQLKPDDPRLLFNTAVALDQNRQYRMAANYYQKYLKQSQDEELSTRKQVARRIRVLQAELAAYPHKEEQAQ